MDFLERGYSPYDYTFNFWNDYLGLSTMVSKGRMSGPPCSPNSITESLKATLGLEDDDDDNSDSAVCSCVIGHNNSSGGDGGHSDCCSIYDLKERLSLLRPYEHITGAGGRLDSALGDTDSPFRGSFSGLEMLSNMDRRRKQQTHQRCKPEPRVCVFCRNNGAPEEVYGTHILKTADGRVLCPILRAYTCPLCSANGDHAHTIKYCPLSRDQQQQQQSRAGSNNKAGSRVMGKRLKMF